MHICNNPVWCIFYSFTLWKEKKKKTGPQEEMHSFGPLQSISKHWENLLCKSVVQVLLQTQTTKAHCLLFAKLWVVNFQSLIFRNVLMTTGIHMFMFLPGNMISLLMGKQRLESRFHNFVYLHMNTTQWKLIWDMLCGKLSFCSWIWK